MIACTAAWLPGLLWAHHSFPVFYNTSRVAEVAGTIVDVVWANPHVRFSLRSENGEHWEVESNSVRGMERAELSELVIAVDGWLKVAGFPARNGEKKMYSSNVLLPDGSEVVLRPGSERRWTEAPSE